jgi:hypothetical protein
MEEIEISQNGHLVDAKLEFQVLVVAGSLVTKEFGCKEISKH